MSGESPHIKIGQIVGTHGVKGGLKVFCLTDFRDRYEAGQLVFLKGTPRKIVRSNWHKDQVRIQLQGVNSIEEADLLKWEHLTVPEDSKPTLNEGEYLERDLIGCEIVTVDGQHLGQLDEVIALPAHDVFRFGETMVPAVHQFVKRIELETRTITVELIPGMLPGETESP